MENFANIANKLVEDGKWQKLLEFADKSLAELTENAENYNYRLAQVYYAKAQALNFLEDFEQVKVYLEKIFELEPTKYTAQAYYVYAWNLFDKGQNSEALPYVNKAIELNPNDSSYYATRANIYDNLNQFENAMDDCNKSIKLNAQNLDVYYLRGLAKAALSLYAEAIEDLNFVLNEDPNHSQSYGLRGCCYNGLEMPEQALEDFNRALELNPDDFASYANRGDTKAVLKDVEGAIEDYNNAIELGFNTSDTYYTRGYLKCCLENYQEGILDFDKAIELNSNNMQAYFKRGGAKYYLKKRREAILDFDKAIELGSNDPNTYYYRAKTKYELNYVFNSIIQDLDKGIELGCNNAEIYFIYGNCKFKLEQYKEALEYYNKTIELESDNPEYYFKRAKCYAKLYKYKLYIEDMKMVKKLDESYEASCDFFECVVAEKLIQIILCFIAVLGFILCMVKKIKFKHIILSIIPCIMIYYLALPFIEPSHESMYCDKNYVCNHVHDPESSKMIMIAIVFLLYALFLSGKVVTKYGDKSNRQNIKEGNLKCK